MAIDKKIHILQFLEDKYNTRDIHILRNNESINIAEALIAGYDLYVGSTKTNTNTLAQSLNYILNNPSEYNIDMTHTARFVPKLNGVGSSGSFSMKNVTVNLETGDITAIPVAVGDDDYKDFSFMLNIHIKTTAFAPDSSPASEFKIDVKINVHDKIDEIWLTPDTLDIPRGSSNFKFSVYGSFDDGTVGDLTYHPDFNWTSSNINNNTTPPNSLPLVIKSISSGKITPNDENQATDPLPVPASNEPYPSAQITATVSDALRNWNGTGLDAASTDTADVSVISTIFESKTTGGSISTTEYTAKLVGGANIADEVDERINFLFLADGFESGDESTFNSLVRNLLRKIKSGRNFSPYFELYDSINFWSCFTPSKERGVNFWDEMLFVKREKLTFSATSSTPGTALTVTRVDAGTKLELLEPFSNIVDGGYFGSYSYFPFYGIKPTGEFASTIDYVSGTSGAFKFYTALPQIDNDELTLTQTIEVLGYPTGEYTHKSFSFSL